MNCSPRGILLPRIRLRTLSSQLGGRNSLRRRSMNSSKDSAVRAARSVVIQFRTWMSRKELRMWRTLWSSVTPPFAFKKYELQSSSKVRRAFGVSSPSERIGGWDKLVYKEEAWLFAEFIALGKVYACGTGKSESEESESEELGARGDGAAESGCATCCGG